MRVKARMKMSVNRGDEGDRVKGSLNQDKDGTKLNQEEVGTSQDEM